MKTTGPNLLIVGAPKCGTTAMWRYLGQHPDIWMCPKKDLHFFGSDLEFQNRDRLGKSVYLSHFKANEESVVGEASVWYLLSTKAAEEIHAFDPKMKIIIMLRDPVKTIYAHYTQMLFNGLGDENVLDFESALNLESKRKRGEALPPNTPLRQALFYREVVSFAVQVQRFQNHFKPNQVHIVLQDDLVADTAKVVSETFSFLGVDPTHKIDTKAINRHKVVRFEAVRKLIAATPTGLKSTIPTQFRQRLSRQIRKLNSKHEKRKPMDPRLSNDLRLEFAPDIQRLAELIGRDLSHWLPKV